MILLDSSGLIAFLDASDRFHAAAARTVAAEPGPFLLSPFVLAEVDYFLLDRLGLAAELALLGDIVERRYELVEFGAEELRKATDVVARYGEHAVGLADASIVVLAERYGTDRVLTLDERHFRALQTLDGRPFTLLPADA